MENQRDSCPHGFAWISELETATSVEALDANPYPDLESRVSLAIKKSIKQYLFSIGAFLTRLKMDTRQGNVLKVCRLFSLRMNY